MEDHDMWGSQGIDHEPVVQPNDGGAVSTRPATLYVVSAPRGAYVQVVKPIFDRVVAGLVLLVALPALVACAIAVRASLGPSILFAQERVGRDGRRFRVYKFRTMHPDRRHGEIAAKNHFVGEDRRETHKSADDPRLTGVGRFLRKWSLDELPQLFNVVRGDMSIIGPRPELPAIVSRYTEWEHARHMVKPGLTGLWQVSARGAGRPMHEHVAVDVEYVAGLSLSLDARILIRTPLALITNRGF